MSERPGETRLDPDDAHARPEFEAMLEAVFSQAEMGMPGIGPRGGGLHDESDKLYVGREFASVEEFARWFAVQGLGAAALQRRRLPPHLPSRTPALGRLSLPHRHLQPSTTTIPSSMASLGTRPAPVGLRWLRPLALRHAAHLRRHAPRPRRRRDRRPQRALAAHRAHPRRRRRPLHRGHEARQRRTPRRRLLPPSPSPREIPLQFIRDSGIDNPDQPLGIMYHRDQNPDWIPGDWPKSCPGLQVSHENLDPDLIAVAQARSPVALGRRGRQRRPVAESPAPCSRSTAPPPAANRRARASSCASSPPASR